MARKPKPEMTDDDAPALTDAQLAEMKPAADVLPADLYATLTKRLPGQRGPGKRPAKVLLTIRVEPEVLDAYKATGPGWQARAGAVLQKGAKALAKRA